MTTTISYGDTVRIAADAPERYCPDAMGSACGFRVVASEMESKAAGEPVGTLLWLVEFSDGSAREVPAHYLTRIENLGTQYNGGEIRA
jgi:hypothetical protein